MNIKDILNDKNFTEFLAYIQKAKSIVTAVITIRNNNEYTQFLVEHTKYMPDMSSVYYRVMLLRHNILSSDNLPRCKNCGNLLEDKDIRKYFQNGCCFCSQACYKAFPKSEETLQKQSNNMKRIWSQRDDNYKKMFYDKVEQTNIERYGTKCTLNTEENIHKKKTTWLQNYGVDNPLKSNHIRQKIYDTNTKRYGNICPLNNSEIKDKAKETLFNNYGVSNPMESPIIVERLRKNVFEKYGVNWASKSDEVWKKYCNTLGTDAFKMPKFKKYHTYQYPSGKEIIVQGYEDLALDFYILKNYDEYDIENSIIFMNTLNIKYIGIDGVNHRYIPDFYIKSQNLIIEVKSEFTFYTDLDKIERKCKAAIDKGYNIFVLVFKHVDRKKLNIKYKLYNYEDVKVEKEKYCNEY